MLEGRQQMQHLKFKGSLYPILCQKQDRWNGNNGQCSEIDLMYWSFAFFIGLFCLYVKKHLKLLDNTPTQKSLT